MTENFERKGGTQEKFKQCPDCGLMNNSDQNYCVDCGAELPPAEDESDNKEGDNNFDNTEDDQDDAI